MRTGKVMIGSVGDGEDKYEVVKIFRKSGRKKVLYRYLRREEAMKIVNRFPDSKTSMVVFFEMR